MLLEEKIQDSFKEYSVLPRFIEKSRDDETEYVYIIEKETRVKVASINITYENEKINVEVNNSNDFKKTAELKSVVKDWFYQHSTHRIRLLNEMIELDMNEYDARIREIPIEMLDFSPRAYNCLKRDGYTTVGKIAKLTKNDLNNIHQLGAKSVLEIVYRMKDLGININ